MFGVDDLILGGLAMGGSLLSGIGANKSAKKQNKIAAARQAEADQTNRWLQEVANARNQDIQRQTNEANQGLQESKNAADRALGASLLARADALGGGFDLSGFLSAGDKSGFNRVTWLNSGVASLFDHRSEKQAYVAQGTALQSPGFTTLGATFENWSPAGVAPTVNEPSMLSAVGGAISAGASAFGSSYQNNQRVDAAKQSSMLQYLASVQYARKSGNALAGLGTPSFETSNSVAAVAKKIDAKSAYGYNLTPLELSRGGMLIRSDPSIPNDQSRNFLSGFFNGLGTNVADGYYSLSGRNMAADNSIATDNYFRGPGYRTSGPIDEAYERRREAEGYKYDPGYREQSNLSRLWDWAISGSSPAW